MASWNYHQLLAIGRQLCEHEYSDVNAFIRHFAVELTDTAHLRWNAIVVCVAANYYCRVIDENNRARRAAAVEVASAAAIASASASGRVREAEAKTSAMQAERDVLRADMHALVTQTRALQADWDTLATQTRALQAAIVQLRAERQHAEATIVQLRETNRKLQDDRDDFEQKMVDRTLEYEDLDGKYQALQEENRMLREANAFLREQADVID